MDVVGPPGPGIPLGCQRAKVVGDTIAVSGGKVEGATIGSRSTEGADVVGNIVKLSEGVDEGLTEGVNIVGDTIGLRKSLRYVRSFSRRS